MKRPTGPTPGGHEPTMNTVSAAVAAAAAEQAAEAFALMGNGNA